MKKFLLLAAFALCAVAPAHAQKAAKAKPDFTGVWIGVERTDKATYRNTPWPKDPQFTPEGLKKSQYWEDPKNNLGAQCLPTGGPMGMMNGGTFFPVEIIQKDKQVTFIAEYLSLVRRIYLDGRSHPEDVERTWLGHSIGKWEGDTLVIDTVKMHFGVLNGSGAAVIVRDTDKEPRMPFDESVHLTERMRLLDGGKYLEADVTIDDPTIYKAPMRLKRYWRKAPELDVLEYVCAENQRSADEGYEHLVEPKK